MDSFVAALKVGPAGKVIGVDMTEAQRLKAERLRDRDGWPEVTPIRRSAKASVRSGHHPGRVVKRRQLAVYPVSRAPASHRLVAG
jgi:hypothetical protein